MSLAIVLPAWLTGLMATLLHAAMADAGLLSAVAVFYFASAATALLLVAVAALARPAQSSGDYTASGELAADALATDG